MGQRWPQLLAGPVADAHVQALPGHADIRGLCVPVTPLPSRPRACTLCSCTTAMLPAGGHGHAESAVQCPWPAPGHRVLLVAESPSCGSLTVAALLLAGTRAQHLTRSLRPLWYLARGVRACGTACALTSSRGTAGACASPTKCPLFDAGMDSWLTWLAGVGSGMLRVCCRPRFAQQAHSTGAAAALDKTNTLSCALPRPGESHADLERGCACARRPDAAGAAQAGDADRLLRIGRARGEGRLPPARRAPGARAVAAKVG